MIKSTWVFDWNRMEPHKIRLHLVRRALVSMRPNFIFSFAIKQKNETNATSINECMLLLSWFLLLFFRAFCNIKVLRLAICYTNDEEIREREREKDKKKIGKTEMSSLFHLISFHELHSITLFRSSHTANDLSGEQRTGKTCEQRLRMLTEWKWQNGKIDTYYYCCSHAFLMHFNTGQTIKLNKYIEYARIAQTPWIDID